jgi:uncharacterized protein (DUF983 family)
MIFVAQFVQVFLLAWQSQCVAHGRVAWAAGNSLCLGIIGYQITSLIAAYRGEIGSPVWLAFICSGPIAVVLAIKLFRRTT